VVVSDRTAALDAVVFGVDVQSGDVRGDAPSYALVVLDGDSVERDVVSYRKLRRRVESEEPALLATDNMYELAEDKDALVRFLDWLPAGTRLVQVTGAHQPDSLSRVASRHGVPYGKQPMKEAEAAARLAAANVGQEVTAFTDTTEIKVSRGRSTGGGGWSEDRYTRRIHGSVRRRTREIESALDDAGLDYERDATEKYGGLANAVFTVEARPAEIPVSNERSGDVRVEVSRVRRDGIEFQPLAKRRDRVIVGIDPGTTTAAAVVGLEGELLDVMSTRTADTAAVIEWIIERGRPILVGADVTPMPETVEKIRRSFDAAGWVPDRDLAVDVKKHRTRETGYDNDHERDAIAAALGAYDAHADQFDRVAAKVPPRQDLGAVIERVVADEQSVESVLADLTDDEDDEETEAESVDNEPTPEQRRIRQLEGQVEQLQEHVERLETQVEERDERIAEYEEKLSEAKREERREARERREVTRLERENRRLERELDDERDRVEALEGKLERLKELWKLDHSDFADVSEKRAGLVPVKVIDQFTTDDIETAHEQFGLAEDDVVLLRDASGAGWSSAERLAEVNPRVVLRNGQLSDMADRVLFDHDVPVAPAELVTVQEVDELAVARESEVEEAIADWEDRASERERQQSAEMVDRLISEHRADRAE
jgi:predicted RNase H-like nuclease (RuvC/YqgF family)